MASRAGPAFVWDKRLEPEDQEDDDDGTTGTRDGARRGLWTAYLC